MNEIDDFFDKWEKELQEVDEKPSPFVVKEGEMFRGELGNLEYELLKRYYEEPEQRYREIYRYDRYPEKEIIERRIPYKCPCGCRIEIDVIQVAERPSDSYHSQYYSLNSYTILFCPKCGKDYRVVGTVISEKSSFRL